MLGEIISSYVILSNIRASYVR